jgi:hypothetical protein
VDEGGAGLGQGEKEGQAGGELLAAGGVVRSSTQTLHDVAGGCHLPLPEGDDGGLALFPPHHLAHWPQDRAAHRLFPPLGSTSHVFKLKNFGLSNNPSGVQSNAPASAWRSWSC